MHDVLDHYYEICMVLLSYNVIECSALRHFPIDGLAVSAEVTQKRK